MGIRRLIALFDTDVTLVIRSKDPMKTKDLIESIDYHVLVVESEFNYPDSALFVIKMKYNDYIRFMKRLQAKGRNLSQRSNKGLICDLV